MISKRVIGQEIPQQILAQALNKGRLAGTYLFYGPAGVGKFLLAWELAKILLCEEKPSPDKACQTCFSCLKIDMLRHPDLYLIFPHPSSYKSNEGQKEKEEREYQDFFKQTKIAEPYQFVEYSKPINISVDKIRFLKKQVYRRPFQSERKVVIIEQAESMRIDSFNALLKIFEEPPADTVIILTTSQINRILPTVVSRSQKIQFTPLKQETVRTQLVKELNLPEEKADYYASLAEGSLGTALNLASGKWGKILELSYLLWQSLWEKKTGQLQEIIETFNLEKDRSQILLLFRLWQHYLRVIYLAAEGIDSKLPLGQGSANSGLARKSLPPTKIHSAFQLINQARLDFYRNISIKSTLVWLCLALPEALVSD